MKSVISDVKWSNFTVPSCMGRTKVLVIAAKSYHFILLVPLSALSDEAHLLRTALASDLSPDQRQMHQTTTKVHAASFCLCLHETHFTGSL